MIFWASPSVSIISSPCNCMSWSAYCVSISADMMLSLFSANFIALLATGSESSTNVSTCVAHLRKVFTPSSFANVGGNSLGFFPSNIFARPALGSRDSARPSIASIRCSISNILSTTTGLCPLACIISDMISCICVCITSIFVLNSASVAMLARGMGTGFSIGDVTYVGVEPPRWDTGLITP
eukprot:10012091-Karenia_brevis.AAC.1